MSIKWECFVTYKTLEPPRPIAAANGEEFLAIGEGDMYVLLPNTSGGTRVRLTHVLHAPETAFSLVSIRRADEAGFTAVFEYGVCKLIHRETRAEIGHVTQRNGLYQVVTSRRPELAMPASSRPSDASELEVTDMEFHRTMGHIGLRAARELVTQGRVTGVSLKGPASDEACDTCIHSKITRRAVPKESDHAGDAEHTGVEAYGDRIDGDVWTPGPRSLRGNVHGALYIDRATHYEHGAVFKTKDGADDGFRALEAELRTQYGIQIKWFHSDGGGEFMSLKPYLREKGIRFTTTVHDTPEQNGMVERGNRVHRERVSAMLHDASLPMSLWSYAFLHSVYLRNRTGHSALGGKTPYEARFGSPPNVSHLRPFGARVVVRCESHPKLELRGRDGRFVGFSPQHKDGVYVYWPDRRNVTVERNYVWLDAAREGASDAAEFDANEIVARVVQPGEPGVPEPGAGAGTEDQVTRGPGDKRALEEGQETGGGGDDERTEDHGARDVDGDVGIEPEDGNGEVVEEEPVAEELGRGKRVRKPGPYLRRLQQGEGTVDGRTRASVKYPRGMAPEEFMGALSALETVEDEDDGAELWGAGDIRLDPAVAYVAYAIVDPKSVAQARTTPEWPLWKEAIDIELQNLRDHEVYELVEAPSV